MTSSAIALEAGLTLPEDARSLMGTDSSFLRGLLRPTGTSNSIALDEPRRRAMLAIVEMASRATAEDWDHEGGSSVQPSSVAYALRFVQTLPAGVPVPDVEIDRDGEITLDWYGPPRHVFSVTIGRDGLLTYAGLFGVSKAHGIEPFLGAIPSTVAQGIARVALAR